MPDALIFVPLSEPNARYWVMACWSYCLRQGYNPIAVVHQWSDVTRLILEDGLLAVIVIGRRDHLDPKREPRLEVIAEEDGRDDEEMRRPTRRWEDRPQPPGPARR